MKKVSIFLLVIVLVLGMACTDSPTEKVPQAAKVEIIKNGDKYALQVNNAPFEIKGAGLDVNAGTNFKALAEAGGNAFRTWHDDNMGQQLDSAKKYNLMMAAGLPLGQELHHFDYSDEAAVKKQFEKIKKTVDTYKDHPNLLCWVAGNELNLLFDENGGLKLVSPDTYKALAQIVDYIHENDPNHPVGTTFAGATESHIALAMEHCPQLDFVGLQVYGALAVMNQQVTDAKLRKPYMVTEFGPVGHWEMPATPWGREIEECSGPKAAGMISRIQTGIVDEKSGLNIGHFAFLWGQKQERTPTWYGMFNKSGEATARIDELTKFWTGSYPENRAPLTESMTIDGKNAFQSVYLKPNTSYDVEVLVSDPDEDSLTYQWVMLKEVGARSQGGAFEQEPEAIEFEVKESAEGKLTFVTPEAEGDYRLFSYAYDGKGKVGNANVPFFIQK
jgi:hypothetical protein